MGVARPPNQNKTSSGDLSLPPPVLLSEALQTVPSLNEYHPASQGGASVVLGNSLRSVPKGMRQVLPHHGEQRMCSSLLGPGQGSAVLSHL